MIMEAFADEGGGSLHYCGGAKKLAQLQNTEPLPALYQLRQSGDARPIQAEYAFLKQKDVAIVGWGNNEGYARIKKDIETGDAGSPILTGLTLMCEAGSAEAEAMEIIRRHGELCAMHREKSA